MGTRFPWASAAETGTGSRCIVRRIGYGFAARRLCRTINSRRNGYACRSWPRFEARRNGYGSADLKRRSAIPARWRAQKRVRSEQFFCAAQKRVRSFWAAFCRPSARCWPQKWVRAMAGRFPASTRRNGYAPAENSSLRRARTQAAVAEMGTFRGEAMIVRPDKFASARFSYAVRIRGGATAKVPSVEPEASQKQVRWPFDRGSVRYAEVGTLFGSHASPFGLQNWVRRRNGYAAAERRFALAGRRNGYGTGEIRPGCDVEVRPGTLMR